MRRSVLILFALFWALLSTVTHAQSCGGNLSCNLSSVPVYTFTNTNSVGYGVAGITNSTANSTAGVFGVDGGGSGVGGCGPSVASAGVRGESWSGNGVVGMNTNRTLGAAGVSGYNVSYLCVASYTYGQLGVQRTVGGVGKFYGVWSGGDFGGTGAKYFVEPHPTDASKEIRYVSLEGPEAGTYFRGKGRIARGFATIEVPESFRMVTDEEGLTVVVTPVGQMATLAVISQDLNKIVVQGSKDVKFNYLVNGIRRAYKDFKPISENDDFVPDGPDDTRFFTLPVESQRRLVETGVYTPDGKVDLAKAHEMGWDRKWVHRND